MTTRWILLASLAAFIAGCSHHGPINEAKPSQSLAEVLTDIPNPAMASILHCSDGHEWLRVDRNVGGEEKLDAIWDTSTGSLVWEKDRKYIGGLCVCIGPASIHTWGAEPASCGSWTRDDAELAKLKARFAATPPASPSH